MDHAKRMSDVEVIGFLTGRMEDQALIIEEAIDGVTKSEGAKAVMSSEAIAKIADDIINKRTKGNVVGWYHSHPRFGLFLSDVDVRTQAKLQQFSPYVVALVVDPTSEEVGFFTLDPQTKAPVSISEEHVHVFSPEEPPVPDRFRSHPFEAFPASASPARPGYAHFDYKKPESKTRPKPSRSRFLLVLGLCIGLAIGIPGGVLIGAQSPWQDRTLPTIKDTTQTTPYSFQKSFNITANVTDNIGISHVMLNYSIGYREWITKTMPFDNNTGGYYYSLSYREIDGNLTYYIVANDTANNIARTEPRLVTIIRESSSITCKVDPSIIIMGETTNVTGQILGASQEEFVIIEYAYEDPAIMPVKHRLPTYAAGHFEDLFNPTLPGTWYVSASWDGNTTHRGSESPTRPIDVEPAPSVIIQSPTTQNPAYRGAGSYVDVWYNYTIKQTVTNGINVSIEITNATKVIGNYAEANLESGSNKSRKGTVLLEAADDGRYDVSVTVDYGANLMVANATGAVVVDSTPPTINIEKPSYGANVNGSTIWINGTINEPNKSSTPPTINNTALFALTDWKRESGRFAFSNRTSVADGNMSLSVTFQDMAGNKNETKITFVVDNTSPIATITSPQSGDPPLAGSIQINITVSERNSFELRIYFNNTLENSYSDQGDRTYLYPCDTTKYPNGTYIISVAIEDLAGNTGEAKVGVTVSN